MPLQDLRLAPAEFDLVRKLCHERFGIALDASKVDMVSARIDELLRRSGAVSFRDYYERILKNGGVAAFAELADCMTTNYTFFNREPAHFEHFAKVALPEAVQRSRGTCKRDLRIWCAAASTGEEPYTLAMWMMNHMGASYATWDAGILATDLSREALTTATKAVYPNPALERLPQDWRARYFTALPGGRSRVCDELRAEVMFRKFNLSSPSLPFRTPFDVIFCRNVMIYFDAQLGRALVDRLFRITAPGGYLYVGSADPFDQEHTRFELVQPGVFRKPH